MSATYVLFHSDCYDGFGAAWAAWRALSDDAAGFAEGAEAHA